MADRIVMQKIIFISIVLGLHSNLANTSGWLQVNCNEIWISVKWQTASSSNSEKEIPTITVTAPVTSLL